MTNEIKIQCETKLYLPIENLNEFQGELKTLSTVNFEKLKKQIIEQGFSSPFLVWKNNGTYFLLDGHQRKRVVTKLKEAGYKVPDLPCVEIFAKTKLEAKKKLLSYVSQFGKVESQGLYEFIIESEIPIEDMADFEIPEIDMTEFKAEFFADEPPAGAGSEDNVPEVAQNELGVKLGDIYQLGEHRLMCGDSTDLKSVEKLMNGEKADITFTSPPYNAGKTPKENGKYKNDSDDKESKEYLSFLTSFTELALKESEFVFVNIQSISGNKIPLIEYLYDLKEVYADSLIWNKLTAQPAMANNVLNSQFEYVHVFSYKANRSIGTKSFRGTLSNVIDMSSKADKEFSKEHKATMPVSFAEHFVWNFSNKSVYEPFAGTGSTLIACEKTDRKCFGMELDPHYCSVIIKRWEEYTGLKHKKL